MSGVTFENLRGYAASRWGRLLRQFDDLDALRQRLDYQTYILAAAGLVSSLLLGFADLATHGAIEVRRNEDIQVTLQQVLPDSLHDNVLLDDVKTITEQTGKAGTLATPVYIARRNGAVTGVAFKFTANGGYSGPIMLMMGMDKDGAVLGVRVVAHAETPGLGDKIERNKSDWIESFNSRSLDNTSAQQWKVKKDGGDFDQFAGATITPRAVVHGVESGLEFFQRHKTELLEQP
jgi:electron transport complex protein RnfG